MFRRISFSFLAIIALVAVVMLKTDNWSLFKESQMLFLVFALYPPVLVLLTSSKILNRKGLLRGMPKYLGKLSYEMYVWHFPLLILLNVILIISGYPIVHRYKSMALFEVAVILFSIVMCKFVEPGIDAIAQKIFKPESELL